MTFLGLYTESREFSDKLMKKIVEILEIKSYRNV